MALAIEVSENGGDLMKRLHHFHSPWRRGLYSAVFVSSVMAIGTVGLHVIERVSYLDAFYFMSMIATAQGPMTTPVTALGKLFISFMAFLSVGTVVTALGFLFGPFFGRLWHIGVVRVEEEIQLISKHEKRP